MTDIMEGIFYWTILLKKFSNNAENINLTRSGIQAGIELKTFWTLTTWML